MPKRARGGAHTRLCGWGVMLMLCASACSAANGGARARGQAQGGASRMADASAAADASTACLGCSIDAAPAPASRDAALAADAADASLVPESTCPAAVRVAPGCLTRLDSEARAGLCNGLDDDCDGHVDEGCACTPGAVQPCFAGPPGLRGHGACSDGTQRCLGIQEFGASWGACEGGITPKPETCDSLDNDCNGCADDIADCRPLGKCPAPGDPRVQDAAPFSPYLLRGKDFFDGVASAWSWTLAGGPCDQLALASPSYSLDAASSETATFTPRLSGDYTTTLSVTQSNGELFTCTWIVHVRGPGLRVEMCYPESTSQDLDLYLKQPAKHTPWFSAPVPATPTQFDATDDECSWFNCEANIRGTVNGLPAQRASWGYLASPLSECQGGPQGATWQSLGYCANPRLDIDNNLQEGTGLPENINVDAPRDAESFRIMVTNFTGAPAHPLVNVYCAGRRLATFGAAPDQLTQFSGSNGGTNVGAMWRVADVTTHVGASAELSCDVVALHPPGTSSGFDVTYDDPRY